MKQITWNCSQEEMQLLSKITQRAVKIIHKNGGNPDALSLNMDITACHLNGNPLKLKELLEADDFNFLHDIAGISRYINRHTGELGDCFVPRYSK
jgi:hypothetical protein